MDINVLNKDFEIIKVDDNFKSFIWVERFSECGDFELYNNNSNELLSVCKPDYYVSLNDSSTLMIIERIETETDIENGSYLIIKGRSLESLLLRRLIWGVYDLSGNLQTVIKTLITNNIISPSDAKRKIQNFIFEDNPDPRVNVTITPFQVSYENLYEVISKLCVLHNIGFKIRFDYLNKGFIFNLYAGTDRSFKQSTNPFVIFSRTEENLINAEVVTETSNYCNVTLVGGEGDDFNRKTLTVGDLTKTGVDRREIYTDAKDLSAKDDSGNPIPMTTYESMLKQRGDEKLKEFKLKNEFNGQIATNSQYKYGVDFFMGDKVQLLDDFNNEFTAKITEYIHSFSNEGYLAYPTFSIE